MNPRHHRAIRRKIWRQGHQRLIAQVRARALEFKALFEA